ncbi:purine and uridine phosphorylase, partial [Aureobasidium melanogenum]
MASSCLPREAYAIGIICALFEEKAAVEAMLDEGHEALDQKSGDTNSYTFGKIGKHNVVIACLPGGQQGKAAAATVAKDMTRSFPIKLGLMVGIGGGVPSQVPDIRLGDVVVSLPVGTHGGVIQYDLGKMESVGFRRKGHLDKPPKALLSAVNSLRAKHEANEPDFPRYLSTISENRRMAKKYGFQGSENDQLFNNNNKRVLRDPREDDSPQVFYGTIGSGDLVMKNSGERDSLAARDKIICFGMEAAGLMNDFPCLVIRGISDYADSRKNDEWQPYAAATAAAYAKELLTAVSVQEVETLGPANQRKHLVPFSLKGVPAIDHFVKRDQDMQKLTNFFLSQTSQPARRKKFVVHGLGGIGKTQLCIEFARKHQARYTAVLWMDGSSEEALQQSFTNAFPMLPAGEIPADPVEAARCQRASPEVIVKGVLDWLSLPSNHDWLHIIDNVDHDNNAKRNDPSAYDLKKYSAQVDHGSLLITSRLSTLTVPQNAHQLTEMNLKEARTLFEDHRGKPKSSQPTRDELKDLERLLQKLQGMPLALAQAGAYIGQTNTSLGEYLDYYDSIWDELIKAQDSYPLQEYAQRSQRSMLTTWRISYQQVEGESLEAATLLKLWAFLDPKDLWYELIACAIELESQIDIPEWLSTLAKNRLKFRGALGLLKKYSLVNNGRDNDNYSMHAVLHSWCRHLASTSSTNEVFPELALSIVTQMLPDTTGEGRALWKRLFPHGQQLLYQSRLDTIWATSFLREAWIKLAKLLKYNRACEEAAGILERALEKEENIFGKDAFCTLHIVYYLAKAYFDLNKHKEAQQLSEHSLAVYEKLLISRPDLTDLIFQNMGRYFVLLGMNYKHGDQMRPEDAEDMFKRAIALCEQRQKQYAEKENALLAMTYLGTLYKRQNRLTEAEMMLERALEVSTKVYGPNHEHTLRSLVALHDVYDRSGKVAEAKDMAERAAAGFDKIFFEDRHPRGPLASERVTLLRRQGKFAEAIVLTEQALTDSEAGLGPKHRETLRLTDRLASLYIQNNRSQEARTLYEQLIPKLEDTFSLHARLSLNVMETLAFIYIENLDMLSEAEELFKRVLTRREESLGPNHVDTLKSVRDLIWVYSKQGDQVREVEMRERVLLSYKNTLGTEDKQTLAAGQGLRQALRSSPGEFSLTSQSIMLDDLDFTQRPT